jgi:hypothetical protein
MRAAQHCRDLRRGVFAGEVDRMVGTVVLLSATSNLSRALYVVKLLQKGE